MKLPNRTELTQPFQQQFVEHFEQAVIGLDLRGKITVWNHAAELLVGWSKIEAAGKALRDLLQGDTGGLPDIEALAAKGERWAEAVRIARKDGDAVWVRIAAEPVRDTNGVVIGCIGEVVAIDEPKQASPVSTGAAAENILLTSEILSHLTDAIFLTDDDGRFVYVCSNVANIFGYVPDEVFSLGNIERLLGGLGLDELRLNAAEKQSRQIIGRDKANSAPTLWVEIKRVSIGQGTLLFTCRDITDQKENEDALYTNMQLLRRVLDTLPVGVWVADKDGVIVLSNPTAQEIWAHEGGRTAEDYSDYRSWVAETGQYIHPADWAIARALRDGEVTLNEIIEIESFDGLRKTVLSSAAPIRDEQGVLAGAIAVNQDITEQRRMEIAERKHRTFANALSNITAVLTGSLDLQTVMERILDHVGRVVPHEAANIMLIEGDKVRVAFWHNYGPKADELFHTTRYPLAIPMLTAMLETGLPQLVGDTSTEPNWVTIAETAWVRSSVGVPIRSRDAVLGFLTLDSSEPNFFKPPDAERLRAFAYQAAIAIENARLFSTVREYANELESLVEERTAELQRAKNHVEAILEHSSDGIALVTDQGVIMQFNPSFKRMFGIHDAVDGNHSLAAFVDADDWRTLQPALDGRRSNTEASRVEVECHRVDGTTFDADIAIAPLFDLPSGNFLYVCNVRDVTQQKTAERELRLALEKEKELNALKTQFVAMVSHEFRTPLASMQTSTDLLYSYYNRISMERRNEIILRIQAEIQQLTILLGDVLTVAKADTVGLVLDLSVVDLNTFCANIVSELGYSIAKNRSIELKLTADELEVQLDQKLFQQILENVLTNAIKYSEEGSTIWLTLEDADDQAVIYVRDQGIGIPSDDLPRLFDAFQRAQNVGDRQGTGLGLAVVKRAVEAHHGTVEVASELGVGTSFTITIPKRQIIKRLPEPLEA